jgi:Cdc6-like AAA superfamily ATPase
LLAAGQHLKRGLLLYGPPGTGKTHTMRYLVGRRTSISSRRTEASGLAPAPFCLTYLTQWTERRPTPTSCSC